MSAGAQFFRRVGVNAGVGSGQIPDARWLPVGFGQWPGAVGHIHFGPLIRQGVVELAAQQRAEVPRVQPEREFRTSCSLAPVIGVRRINDAPHPFLSAGQGVHAPFVARGDFIRLGSLGRKIPMRLLARDIAYFQFIRLDQRRGGGAIPVGHRLVMLGGFILSTVFEADHGVFSERHQVGQQESISRLNFVFFILRLFLVARAHRMAGERQRHVTSTPVIPAATPFLGAGAISLRRLAVIEEKTRVTFQRVEVGAIGKNP